MNAGKMKEERKAIFLKLLELGERYKHVNQYQQSIIVKNEKKSNTFRK